VTTTPELKSWVTWRRIASGCLVGHHPQRSTQELAKIGCWDGNDRRNRGNSRAAAIADLVDATLPADQVAGGDEHAHDAGAGLRTGSPRTRLRYSDSKGYDVALGVTSCGATPQISAPSLGAIPKSKAKPGRCH
jgi:hypothetical protein